MGDIITPLRDALRQHGPLALPARIALERTIAGLTASHCARAMGWSHTRWQDVENGIRRLSAPERRRVAKMLGITDGRLQGAQPLAVPGWKKRGRPRREHQAAA